MTDDISKPRQPDAITAPLPAPQPTPVELSALEAARERTIRVLTDRFADDTLSIEEFESRLDRMYKAGSVVELDTLLREVDTRIARSGPGAGATSRAMTYADPPGPRRILSIMSNTERTGRWPMPRQLDIRALMSSIVLDLRDVVMPAGVCEIDILSMMASVEIIVPPGVIVEDVALGVMANVENRVYDDGYTPPDAPRLRVGGTAIMANVEIMVAERGLPLNVAKKEARRAWKRRLKGR